MSMKVSTRQVDGITIMDMSGRITLGEGSVTLRDAVRDVLAKGTKQILLNLGDITYIDSSGIGELVSAFTTVKNSGGELKLLNLTKKVHDLLQITKLYTVFDVKDDVQSVLALSGDADSVRYEADALACLRPGRCARIYRGATAVGWLGELHPQVAKAVNLPSTAFLFELEIELAFSVKPLEYHKISKFPSVRRDLAIVVNENVPLAVLRENVSVSATGLLHELRVFDVYRGAGVESGRKSVALGLILQDSSRTLTDVDADAVVTAVVARLRDELSATIRDQ